MSRSTTTIILTATTLTISIEVRAIDPVKAAAETGNTILNIAAARLMEIKELPASLAEQRANNPPELAIDRDKALALEILAELIDLVAAPVPEILAAAAVPTVRAEGLAQEILVGRIVPVVARVLQRDPPAAVHLAPAAAPAHQPDHLAAARIVSAIAAFRPADLVRATVHSAAVAEAPRDPLVRAADTAWVVADLAAVADAAVVVADAVVAAADVDVKNS